MGSTENTSPFKIKWYSLKNIAKKWEAALQEAASGFHELAGGGGAWNCW